MNTLQYKVFTVPVFDLGQFTVLMSFKLVITVRSAEVAKTEKIKTCIAL